MISTSRPLWLLLLLVLGAAAQDAPEDGSTPDDAAAGDAGDADTKAADGEGDDCECSEGWQYVEFLKKEVNTDVSDMLTKDFKNPSPSIIQDTMSKVIEIRNKLLERIQKIRKGDESIEICKFQDIEQKEKLSDFRMDIMEILLMMVDANAEEKLKEISDKLLDFRRTINDEIIRILMLPQPDCNEESTPPPPTGECEPFTTISKNLTTILDCSKKEEADKGDEQTPEADPADPAAPSEDGECVPPDMYSMALISVNEQLDKSIEEHYNNIIKETDEEKRTEFFTMLTMMKGIREEVDEVITKLLPLTGRDDDIKKEVKKIEITIQKVDEKKKECNPCDSCAQKIYEDSITQMESNLVKLEADRDDSSKLESVRGEMISFINKNTEKAREILEKKITGDIDDCERQKLDAYNMTKGPMWMLVNSTIFHEVPEVTAVIKMMKVELKKKLQDACDNKSPPPPITDNGGGCEWAEYESTKGFVDDVDNHIHKTFYNGKDLTEILLAFVDLQKKFDERVKTLFVDEAQCGDELQNIKTSYMPIVRDCMNVFMADDFKLESMTRKDRLACIKGLRTVMEVRNTELLQIELESSFNGLDGSGRKGRSWF